MLLKLVNFVRAVVIVSAIPIFLVTTNTRLVINASSLYQSGFEKYQIDRVTGIEYDQLLLASEQMRDYFSSDDVKFYKLIGLGIVVACCCATLISVIW